MTRRRGRSSTGRSTSPWNITGGSTRWTWTNTWRTRVLPRWPGAWGFRLPPGKRSGMRPKAVPNELRGRRSRCRFRRNRSSRPLKQSGLRGRGGAGFPTGQKWRMVRQQPGETKYVICNGDEGDPGAFMDRMILESFPYRVIEGLAIAAVAVGAHEAIFYIRHEYPQALRRVRAALAECERRGWLGERLLGSDYPLRISIKEGAGAFVCGEETALIASVEGRRGMPRLRPPFPGAVRPVGQAHAHQQRRDAGDGAVDHPPRRGGLRRHRHRDQQRHEGVRPGGQGPPGRADRDSDGHDPPPDRRGDRRRSRPPGAQFKAVQIGGPSGGCVPARLADTPVDYESLRDIGAIMGSGGLVVLDDTACMVDIARYFLQFTQNQSCGKCTFCRIGTKRMLELLELLCAGKASRKHLEELEQLAPQVTQGSLCGLGKTAPNPVLTTLRYFRDEYEAHLQGRCPAGKCTALIKYRVLRRTAPAARSAPSIARWMPSR